MTTMANRDSLPGSKWWKFDLHCHTPASTGDFQSSGEQGLVSHRNWLLAAMASDVDCFAVTDHNSGAWIDPLKEELQRLEVERPEGYRTIHLFPGVEISVTGNIHVLAIFDPIATTDTISSLLGAVGYEGTKGVSDTCTTNSFVDVVEKIVRHGGVAIPSHVDAAKGLLVSMSGQTLEQSLRTTDVIAMELVDPGYVKPGVFAAENVDWVEVIGSDAHQTANLGGRYTWIKMGTPNIEGFRLALTDGDLSVCRHETVGSDKNEHADAILESITVSEAQYCGRGEELTVDLSPWLNTIIGGRGTGKSTLIELARICLRREGELSGAVKQTFDEFKRVPDSREDRGALTDNTQVRVVYRKDGVSYRINWHESNNLADIEERNSSNEWTPVKGDVTRRFPVRLYSQKQVYEMASGLESLLRVIDDTPDVNQSVWHDQWKKEESTYLSLCTQARQMEASLAEEGSLQGELDDIRRRLQVFEKSQYSEILTDYYSRQKQVGAVAKYAQRIRQLPSRLSETAEGFTEPLTENYLTKADVGDGEDAVELAAIYDLFCKDMEAIQTEVLRLAKNARKRIKKWRGDIRTSAWRQHVKTAEKRYLKLATSLAEQNAGEPDEYARLVKRRQMLLTRVAAFEGQRHKLGGIRIRQAESLTTLQKLRRLLTDKRRKFLSSVLDDNEYVSIEVIPYGNRAAVEDQFRRLINKEGTEFKNDIRSGNSEYPGVLDRLFNSYPSEGADDHQFEKCLDQMKTTLVAAAKGIATIRDVRDKRFVSHLERLWQESPEAFDRLMMWFPGDSLKVSYSPEAGGKFRPIDQGSPGQKTAAILAFLLAHGKEPIILDQPEDDLDNHLIYNLIVQQLRQNKQRRQIIVVTHNPNIVVNGDAELVFVLDATKGQTVIELQGGLQEQEVRNAICDVMEGGREAFDRRYRRISVEALR